jgi:hypothetical protein
MLEKQGWVSWVVNGCLEGKLGSLNYSDLEMNLAPQFRSAQSGERRNERRWPSSSARGDQDKGHSGVSTM